MPILTLHIPVATLGHHSSILTFEIQKSWNLHIYDTALKGPIPVNINKNIAPGVIWQPCLFPWNKL